MAPANNAQHPHDEEEAPDAIRVSWITMPAALLDVAAAAIIVNHATAVTDMAPVVWATAYILDLFLIWVYHVGHTTRSCSRAIFVFARVFYGGLLGFVLWDHSRPHEIYTHGRFVMTESSTGLLAAALMTALVGAGLLYHFMVLGRVKRVVPHPDPAPEPAPPPSPQPTPEPPAPEPIAESPTASPGKSP